MPGAGLQFRLFPNKALRCVTESVLLHELVASAAQRSPGALALGADDRSVSYGELAAAVESVASGLVELGLRRGQRLAIWLDKRVEFVVACFATSAAGGVFVPVNPLLKPEQVAHILADCNVRILVTTAERCALLQKVLPSCPDLREIVLVASDAQEHAQAALRTMAWNALASAAARTGARVLDGDMAAILYTSGCTGRPKGVVLSHRNMVTGAKSVASYLGNHAGDTLLAVLPLSFDAGFSQLTTAFHAGARVVLLNYLMPKDVLKALGARARHRADSGAAALHSARAAPVAEFDRRAFALFRQHRRAHAEARHSCSCASVCPKPSHS